MNFGKIINEGYLSLSSLQKQMYFQLSLVSAKRQATAGIMSAFAGQAIVSSMIHSRLIFIHKLIRFSTCKV